jgi:hypothetical protein
MPNFDGTGLLKQGQKTGQGSGPCAKCCDGCRSQTNPADVRVKDGPHPE